MAKAPVDLAPRLFLITPPVANVAHFAPLLEAAVAAADIACVLLRVQNDGDLKAIVRALAPIAQGRGAAALIENDSRLVDRIDADGVHITQGGPDLKEAITALQPRRIVGCGDLVGRDAAMAAGEAGVDYLMFGGPGADHADTLEQVAWWAAIFNVPCVGYAASPDLAGEIAEAGAEFVALCDGLWTQPEQIAATLRDVERVLSAVGVPT